MPNHRDTARQSRNQKKELKMGVRFEEMVFVTTSFRSQRCTHEDFPSHFRSSCPRSSAWFRPVGLSWPSAAAFLCARHGLLLVGESGAVEGLQGTRHREDSDLDRGVVGGG